MVRFLVVLLCCLAAGVVWIALAGPERWHKKVRSQVRPGAPEPTESGYKLLFWRNWLVALIMVALAVVAVDHTIVSDAELYDAAERAVDSLDGTTGAVGPDRIEAVVETAVNTELLVREAESENSEPDDPERYEIVKGETADDRKPAVCVEIRRVGAGSESGVSHSYTSVSQGACT
jgi:hypothetical protein